MTALQQIKKKAQKDGQKKNEETISREDSIAQETFDAEKVLRPKITHVRNHDFIRKRFLGFGKRSLFKGWLHSFFKQFYGSVTKSDYVVLRLGFINSHCKGNPKFNFHKYMIRALEDDFRKVVGISWYLWVFVVVFLLPNVNGWHTYFWIAFVPFANDADYWLLTDPSMLNEEFGLADGSSAQPHTAPSGVDDNSREQPQTAPSGVADVSLTAANGTRTTSNRVKS